MKYMEQFESILKPGTTNSEELIEFMDAELYQGLLKECDKENPIDGEIEDPCDIDELNELLIEWLWREYDNYESAKYKISGDLENLEITLKENIG